MVQEIASALTVKVMQTFVNAHSWVWPVCEMTHYVGMSLIMGIIGVLDLRVLGLFRGIPAGALRPLVPIAIVGFVFNLLTGIVFVTGTGSGAVFYVDNLSFQLKMLCVLLAGANLLYFHYSGIEEGDVCPAGRCAGTAQSQGDCADFARVVVVHHLLRPHADVQRHPAAVPGVVRKPWAPILAGRRPFGGVIPLESARSVRARSRHRRRSPWTARADIPVCERTASARLTPAVCRRT